MAAEQQSSGVLSRSQVARAAKWRSLYDAMMDAGELDRVLDGLFHNYPAHAPALDPDLNKVLTCSLARSLSCLLKMVSCAEWFAVADALGRGGDGDFALAVYTPFAGLPACCLLLVVADCVGQRWV